MNIYEDVWEYPEKNVTMRILKGYGCKLKNPLGEIFWVRLMYQKNGYYFGIVNNILFKESVYNVGDHVLFQKKHIWDVMTPERRNKESIKIKKIMNEFYNIHKRTPSMMEIIKIENGQEITIGL
jgi:hypothetical protein